MQILSNVFEHKNSLKFAERFPSCTMRKQANRNSEANRQTFQTLRFKRAKTDWLSTMSLRQMEEWRYSSMHS
jgi:hypothetical protein